jgi:hypothetical protein
MEDHPATGTEIPKRKSSLVFADPTLLVEEEIYLIIDGNTRPRPMRIGNSIDLPSDTQGLECAEWVQTSRWLPSFEHVPIPNGFRLR